MHLKVLGDHGLERGAALHPHGFFEDLGVLGCRMHLPAAVCSDGRCLVRPRNPCCQSRLHRAFLNLLMISGGSSRGPKSSLRVGSGVKVVCAGAPQGVRGGLRAGKSSAVVAAIRCCVASRQSAPSRQLYCVFIPRSFLVTAVVAHDQLRSTGQRGVRL